MNNNKMKNIEMHQMNITFEPENRTHTKNAKPKWVFVILTQCINIFRVTKIVYK